MTPADDLTLFMGGALFHAVTHLLTHETYHGVRHRLSDRRVLRNHDVRKALRRSAIAAVEMIENDCFSEAPKQHRRMVNEFKRRLADAFPSELTDVEAHADAFLDPSHVERGLEGVLGPLLPDIPEVRDVIVAHFPASFSFAFREIGLKANPKVRAVIVEGLLRNLIIKAGIAEQSVQEVLAEQRTLNSTVRDMSWRFDVFASRSRQGTTQLKETLESLVRRVKALDIIAGGQGHIVQSPRFSIAIADAEDHHLKSYETDEAEVTIGRSATNTIVLLDGRISGRHARLHLDDEIVLEDLASRNGTYVGQSLVSGTVSLREGESFRIGPYLLTVRHVTATEFRPTPTTWADLTGDE